MAEESVAREARTRRERIERTTRRHRCDYAFLELLGEDFGIRQFPLRCAFMGRPPAPKKQAIALCEWATRASGGDADKAGEALRGWARKNGRGMHRPAITGAPPPAFGGRTGFEMEGV